MSEFRSRLMMAAKTENEYIIFEDPAVEAICIANWSSDGIGLSYQDAAAVTSLGTVFDGNTEITKFNELVYFTNVKVLYSNAFQNCTNLEEINLENIIEVRGNVCRSTKIKDLYLPRLRINNSGYYAFSYNTSLQTVIIDNLKSIDSGQFLRYCSNLKWTVWRVDTLPTITRNSNWQNAGGSIYVNDDMYDSFKTLSATHITNKLKKLSEFSTDWPDVVLPEKVII